MQQTTTEPLQHGVHSASKTAYSSGQGTASKHTLLSNNDKSMLNTRNTYFGG